MSRIALEATCLTEEKPTGVARYARELLSQLAAQHYDDDLLAIYRTSRYVRGAKFVPQLPGVSNRMWSKRVSLIAPRGVSLVHALDHVLPDWPKVKKVATIHDMYAHLKIDHSNKASAGRRLEKYDRLIEQADHIICVSESTKRDLLRFYDYPDRQISVVHHGVDNRFSAIVSVADASILTELGLTRPFLLFVGALKASKNVSRLIAAFEKAGLAVDYDLVIAGDGGERANLEQLAAKTKTPTAIKFLGFAKDEHIPVLYRQANGFCLVSLYEGFGIPIIEALKSGTPVITANTGGAAEIARGHSIECDPEDVEAIRTGLLAVVALNGRVPEAAAQHANSFTWAKTAKETYDVYQKLLTER